MIQVSEKSRETSRVIRSARAMAIEMRWMGDEVVRTAQQAVHATTRNKSKWDRWLKPRHVSTDSVNVKWQTYLGSPHHPPIRRPTDHPNPQRHRGQLKT